MQRTIETLAPAKVNLALHVTGQRADGYHLLDSLVMFADFGDRLSITPEPQMSLTVTGPCADGVPADAGNLCWQACERFGESVAIRLEKHLPAGAGIGGGSSDAAAVLRALEQLFDRPAPFDPLLLGADVPVCLSGQAARMQGIGDQVTRVAMPRFAAILVNPGVSVPTPAVFAALDRKTNPALAELPDQRTAGPVLDWLSAQRNDLAAAAMRTEPVIRDVLHALAQLDGVRLVRMSGSGATCVALFRTAKAAAEQAAGLARARPDWWIRACRLS
jgi:4-diphosphocytidyl-2-C-methyl-D-erythritol kinase